MALHLFSFDIYGLFILNIIIVAKTEEGKWDKLKHPELMDK